MATFSGSVKCTLIFNKMIYKDRRDDLNELTESLFKSNAFSHIKETLFFFHRIPNTRNEFALNVYMWLI